MSTLLDAAARAACHERIGRLKSDSARQWGRMTAPQMVCHLNDSFLVAIGERTASRADNVLTRTVVRWVALRTPIPWARGFKTRPEIDQAIGGTRPADWDGDCARLRGHIESFASRDEFAEHPIFGKMSRTDWMIWGYRHVDHHLRQFGV